MAATSLPRFRTDLAGRLRDRRHELEQAVTTRILALAEPSNLKELQYVEGLKMAAAKAIDYGLTAVECGPERSEGAPPILLSQARLAARLDIGLEMVLRRYFAGYALLADFVVDGVEEEHLTDKALLRQLMRDLAAVFDALVLSVSEEYQREAEEMRLRSSRWRAVPLQRLIAGEMIDTGDIPYDFGGHHLGLALYGRDPARQLGRLAAALDRRPLSADFDEEVLWCWLGGRRPVDPDVVCAAFRETVTDEVCLATGEPGRGLEGWRLSHRQARAAWDVARQRRDAKLTRYADVAVVSAARHDEVLLRTLQDLYLAPLEEEGDRSAALRATLRTYLGSERSLTSTAAVLRVTRQTVRNRLRVVEERLGRPLEKCALEVDLALRLAELESNAEK